MNIAIITAGGYGERMNPNSVPKQFLDFRGKPLIIYTLELFDKHPLIDNIVVACLEEWIPFLNQKIREFDIDKKVHVVRGGKTNQDSIFNGLSAARLLSHDEDDIVLIHDGVRPLITSQTITDNIIKVKEAGSCITCSQAFETTLFLNSEREMVIPPRDDSYIARAPQSFFLKDIFAAHEMARRDGLHDFIDSCSMMHHYGYKLAIIIGPTENIKITTSLDFHLFMAIMEAQVPTDSEIVSE